MNAIKRINTAKTVVKKFKSMKTVPAVATRLVAMIEHDNSSLQEFEKIIKMDPILVLRLLKLVNSAYFSLRIQISSISEAVAYVGIENLRNLLILDAIKNLFSKSSSSEKFSRNALWLHSSVTSICCQMVSERIFVQKGEDAFICGLLHDIGLIVENQTMPDKFHDFCTTFNPEKNNLTDYELTVMGTDHPTLSSFLIQEWGLNKEIYQAIETHHKTLYEVSPSSLAGILQITEYLISRLHYNAFPEVKIAFDSPPLLVHMKKNITGYKAIIDDLPYEIHKAKEIYSLDNN